MSDITSPNQPQNKYQMEQIRWNQKTNIAILRSFKKTKFVHIRIASIVKKLHCATTGNWIWHFGVWNVMCSMGSTCPCRASSPHGCCWCHAAHYRWAFCVLLRGASPTTCKQELRPASRCFVKPCVLCSFLGICNKSSACMVALECKKQTTNRTQSWTDKCKKTWTECSRAHHRLHN